MTEVPLIWTTQGNLPISSLEYRTEWENGDTYMKLREIYTHRGEVVRESAHVYAKSGFEAEGA